MKKSLFAFFLLFITSPLLAINVVFRCDDPRVSYDSISNRIIELFIQEQVPLSIAMVPCDGKENPYAITDSIYWRKLNNPKIEICLHGLTHHNIKNHGEFGALSYQETKRRIRLGKDVLQPFFAYPIVTFIPPFNAINDSLPLVLKEEGFLILSSDKFNKLRTNDVLYYPETLGHLMSKLGFWEAVKSSIMDNTSTNDLCVIMFHAYNLSTEDDWQFLEDLLKKCKENKDIHLYTFSSLHQAQVDGSLTRYKANNLESMLSKRYLPQGVFCSTFHCYALHILNAVLYLIFLLITIIISITVTPNHKGKLICLIFGIVIMIIVASCALLHLVGPMKLWLIDILASVMFVMYAFLNRLLKK